MASKFTLRPTESAGSREIVVHLFPYSVNSDLGQGKLLRFIGVGASSFEKELRMKSLVSAILLSSAIGVGTVLAQTSAPAPTGQPATSHMSAEQKSAISKSCSDQANAKGLHGKARWKFRSACKKAGGKAE
jgi:hypothetical protein